MATTNDIAELEKNWLEAESVADELKHEAARIRSRASEENNGEVQVILARAQEVEARHAEAEKAASEAFDQLWQARDGGAGEHGAAINEVRAA